jgi:site-specific recombinase XerC
LGDITTDSMRTAFAQYAETHEAATIQRCWSTWNVLCTFLYTCELIAANPMPLVGRPKLPKTLPKALPTNSVAALLTTLNTDPQAARHVAADDALVDQLDTTALTESPRIYVTVTKCPPLDPDNCAARVRRSAHAPCHPAPGAAQPTI